jgi:2-polyprenyl-6-methoxyphenol hydroxylase-like FAD-dependent oxidoreductase
MMLAAELALAGVEAVVVEQRPDAVLAGSRAGGLHSRSIELLDQRGIADRFLSEGTTVQVGTFGSTVMDVSDFPTRHPYTLGLFQNHIERILAGWVAELAVRFRYDTEVVGIKQDEDGVDVHLAGGPSLRARYVVGCDGGRSLIRKQAGIGFPGWEATRSNLIAELEMSEEPAAGIRHDDVGVHGMGLLADGKTVRVVVTEREIRSGEATMADLSEALIAVYGTDFGIHDPTWLSRFSDMTRQADAYRAGRVLVAGDAAHVHSPAGGQGLGLGLQDAVNLGWKLARVVKGSAPERLLDSYHGERHPVTARTLRYTMAQTMLQRHDERTKALLELLTEVTGDDQPRKRLGGMISGLDVRYDLGEGHPLLGRRMPDLDLETADGPRRVFELLHEAKPFLLVLGEPGSLASDRVPLVEATYAGEWELPVIGQVAAPSAVLVRPDGHVAWVGEGGDAGLADALTTWFGS